MYINKEKFTQIARDFEYLGMTMSPACIEGLRMYLYHKIPAGSFLHSILINDLNSASAKADSHNIHNIPAYIAFLHEYFPSIAWGSEKAVDNWINKGE